MRWSPSLRMSPGFIRRRATAWSRFPRGSIMLTEPLSQRPKPRQQTASGMRSWAGLRPCLPNWSSSVRGPRSGELSCLCSSGVRRTWPPKPMWRKPIRRAKPRWRLPLPGRPTKWCCFAVTAAEAAMCAYRNSSV
ncbi:hypothetical protein SDC9_211450 [bioreactor metagenome]|uniref:Uncharacterized protein n=1 Tax=bioreactor metagenome TaxID=1076179 RepID=A0A645JJ30_9ZZZZ